jgi:hypothetical protein
MAALRFLAALFALVAIIAFVSDLTPSLTGSVPFASTSMETHWARISPSSLKAARENLTQSAWPSSWPLLEGLLLRFPTFAVFAILAAIVGYAGRRRHRVNVFVN